MRTCQCAGCDTLKDCELVGQNWLCEACRDALTAPADVVTPTWDDGANSMPDVEPAAPPESIEGA